MKKNIIYVISVFCLLLFSVVAESKGIKEKIADSYYKNLAYQKAIPLYLELAKSKKANGEIVRKLSDSYSKIGNINEALNWYGELFNKHWANTQDKYEYFMLLRKSGKYKRSIKVMKSYLVSGGVETDYIKYLKENPNYIEKLRAKNKGKYNVHRLSFNSKQHDFCPTYFEKGILFCSPAKGIRIRKYDWDKTNFLQLYYVSGSKGNYSKPTLYNKFSDKTMFHDGPVAFNSNFTEAYLTRSNYNAKGKLMKNSKGVVQVSIFTAKRNSAGGNWSELTPFPYNSKDYSVGCATLSKDGNTMVFASDMPGGNGKSDLWVSKRTYGGEWAQPEHLGKTINTDRRENYPFLDKEGNLYFASDGGIHGLGGYDVFWVPGFLKGKEKVYNLGPPINSPSDDFGFIYDNEKSTGYFNSGRQGSVGDQGKDDIFAFEKLVSLLEVKVIDSNTGKPIPNALCSIYTDKKDLLERNIKTNKKGVFTREFAPNTYYLSASAKGYNDSKKNIVLSRGKYLNTEVKLSKTKKKKAEEKKKDKSKLYKQLEKGISDKKAPKITLDNIYYNFGKYEIRNDASLALDELVEFMLDYPKVKIKLIAHTDSRGKSSYNDWLSKKRALSAKYYLVVRGVNGKRIIAKGMGEKDPVYRCSPCTESQHQANRRTTVEIIND